MKNEDELTELAVRWGHAMDPARRQMLQIIHAVESSSRELTEGEREAVKNFAGEEYLSNR